MTSDFLMRGDLLWILGAWIVYLAVAAYLLWTVHADTGSMLWALVFGLAWPLILVGTRGWGFWSILTRSGPYAKWATQKRTGRVR